MDGPFPPLVVSERAVHASHVFLGVTTPLVILSAVTFGVRLSRCRARTSLWAEVCIGLGFALTLTDWGLLIASLQFQPGPKSPSEFMDKTKNSFFAIPIWGLSMALIKASIGLSLLQIKTSLWFRIYIWFNIVLMGLYGVGNTFFILLSCRPLPAAWGDIDPTGPPPKCVPLEGLNIASTVGAVASILTDVLLALAPLSFLWSLRRPLRERVVLGLLMSLGLFAGVCSLLKNLEIQSLAAGAPSPEELRQMAAAGTPPPPPPDVGAASVYILIWTALEQLVGIVAACTPFCKPLFERYLGTLLSGLPLSISITITRKSSRATATTTSSFGDTYHSAKGYNRATAQDTFRTSKITTGGSEAGGAPAGGGGRGKGTSEDSEEVPLAIEMEPRLGTVGSKRQGVIQSNDMRIESGSVYNGDLGRLESQ